MKKLLVISTLLFAAPFISSAYTINASANGGGSITPAGAVTVAPGNSQSFSISSSGGTHVSDVSVDGVSVGTPSQYTFDNVSADHSISVSAVGNPGGGMLYCSGPMAPGWNVSLLNGGCGTPKAPVYLPTTTILNADGSYTFTIIRQ